jgi:peptidoglycan-associated lipoprotein
LSTLETGGLVPRSPENHMMKHRNGAWLALLGAAALLGGCASGVSLNENVPVETRVPGAVTPGAQAPGATGGPAAQSQVATVRAGQADTVDATGAAALAKVGRVVYFDFDSFVVRDDGKPVVDAHAKVLSTNRTRRMVVEGHTDERGGREYNLALGQKRAQAVVTALTLLGANPAQLEAVSFGKERPADQGATEAAWAKNRRAEIRDVR